MENRETFVVQETDADEEHLERLSTQRRFAVDELALACT